MPEGPWSSTPICPPSPCFLQKHTYECKACAHTSTKKANRYLAARAGVVKEPPLIPRPRAFGDASATNAPPPPSLTCFFFSCLLPQLPLASRPLFSSPPSALALICYHSCCTSRLFDSPCCVFLWARKYESLVGLWFSWRDLARCPHPTLRKLRKPHTPDKAHGSRLMIKDPGGIILM